MKKSTKAILLTAVSLTFTSCDACLGPVMMYGPGPNINDNSNDVSKSMSVEIQNNQIDFNLEETK